MCSPSDASPGLPMTTASANAVGVGLCHPLSHSQVNSAISAGVQHQLQTLRARSLSQDTAHAVTWDLWG